jgi:glycosyltransferase involved in cell wall biosynthesis
MRILLITQIVPYPPDSGPKIKTYNVLRHLARRHQVHLVSFVRSDQERAATAGLEPFCAGTTLVPLRRSRKSDASSLLRSLRTGRPFLVERDDVASMRAAVRALVDKYDFDAVHADQLTMGQYAVDLPVHLRVLDEHNAVWTIVRQAATTARGVRKLVAELEWRKLRDYEGGLCARFDRVTVVSGQDHAALQQASTTRLPVVSVPIAVDIEALGSTPRSADARDVLSVATMFYPPNADGVHWFAVNVFPLVRRVAPGSRFWLVGSRPPARIRRLAGAATGIEVTGYVADLGPILERSAVLVVPVHSGSGMRVKILEAFARGIPVVSTSVGVEGIDACAGEHLLVADTAPDFAAAVSRVVHDRALADRLALAGRSLVRARHDWLSALSGLNEVYGG